MKTYTIDPGRTDDIKTTMHHSIVQTIFGGILGSKRSVNAGSYIDIDHFPQCLYCPSARMAGGRALG
jgi:hypothetical protein